MQVCCARRPLNSVQSKFIRNLHRLRAPAIVDAARSFLVPLNREPAPQNATARHVIKAAGCRAMC